jgi:glyoxylate/hydroxypyruvate reductase A
LIQAGRDEQLVEKDLISAPESVLFKHAVLDVFATEPLPKEHVFWQRTDITITPHNAARSDIEQTARELLYQYNL